MKNTSVCLMQLETSMCKFWLISGLSKVKCYKTPLNIKGKLDTAPACEAGTYLCMGRGLDYPALKYHLSYTFKHLSILFL